MDPSAQPFDITCHDIPDLAPASRTLDCQLDIDVAQIHEYAFREPFIQGPALSAHWLPAGVSLANVFRYPDTSSVCVYIGETQAFLIQPTKEVPLVGIPGGSHGSSANSLALVSAMSAAEHIVSQASQPDAPILARMQVDKPSGRPLHVSILQVLAATIPSDPDSGDGSRAGMRTSGVRGSRWKQGFTFLAKVVATMPYAEYARRVHDRYADSLPSVPRRCPVDLCDVPPLHPEVHPQALRHVTGGRVVQHSLHCIPREACGTSGTASALAVPLHVWRRYDPVQASLRAWRVCRDMGMLPGQAATRQEALEGSAPWADTGLAQTTEEWVEWVCRHAIALGGMGMGGGRRYMPPERRVEYVSEDEEEEDQEEEEGGGEEEEGFETASPGDSEEGEGRATVDGPVAAAQGGASAGLGESSCALLSPLLSQLVQEDGAEDTVPMCMPLNVLHLANKPLPLRIDAAVATLSRCDGVRCSHCGVQVCGARAMLPLQAAGLSGSALRFINPAGTSFRVLTVSESSMLPPLSIQGSPCPDASWFNGYGWSFLQCKGCEQHIGWRYDWVGTMQDGESAGGSGLSRAALDSVDWDPSCNDMVLLPTISWSMEDDNTWRHDMATMQAAEQHVLRARHDAVLSRLETTIGSSLVHRLLEDGVPLAWLWRHRRVLPWPTVAMAVRGEGQREDETSRSAATAASAVPTLRSIVGPPPSRGLGRGMPSAFYGLIAGSVTAKLRL